MTSENVFDNHVAEYDAWFERYPFIYQSELAAIRALLPESRSSLEIGVGSGLFAAPLNIREGIDPSLAMLEKARARGISVVRGSAEALPYRDGLFDVALMVTAVCFLDDIDLAFREAFRVLKPHGCLLIGFVDKNSPIGKSYRKKKQQSLFYQNAVFYSADELLVHLSRAGFHTFRFAQTLFHQLDETSAIEPVHEGYGKGSFVVIKAGIGGMRKQ